MTDRVQDQSPNIKYIRHLTPDASVPRLVSFNFLKLPQNCFAELDVDVSLLSYFMDQLGGRDTTCMATRRRRTPKKASKLEKKSGGVVADACRTSP